MCTMCIKYFFQFEVFQFESEITCDNGFCLLQFLPHLSEGAHSPVGWRLHEKLLSWCCSIALHHRPGWHPEELQHRYFLDPPLQGPDQVDRREGGADTGLANHSHSANLQPEPRVDKNSSPVQVCSQLFNKLGQIAFTSTLCLCC